MVITFLSYIAIFEGTSCIFEKIGISKIWVNLKKMIPIDLEQHDDLYFNCLGNF